MERKERCLRMEMNVYWCLDDRNGERESGEIYRERKGRKWDPLMARKQGTRVRKIREKEGGIKGREEEQVVGIKYAWIWTRIPPTFLDYYLIFTLEAGTY